MTQSHVPMAALGVLALSGCSLLVGFPKEGPPLGVGGQGGGTGGQGGQGGGAVMACYGTSPGAVIDQETWRGVTMSAFDKSAVVSTGLMHLPLGHKLLVYGNTTGGLSTFDIAGAEIFMIGISDSNVLDLSLSGRACDGITRSVTTRRLKPFDQEDTTIVTGTIGPDSTTPSLTWDMSDTNLSQCAANPPSMGDFTVTTLSGFPNSDIPFLSTVQAPGAPISAALAIDGVEFDTDFSMPFLADLGAGQGSIDTTIGTVTLPTPSYFVAIADFSSDAYKVSTLPQLAANTAEPHAAWSGALAIDGAGNAWFGGSACAAPGGCGKPQAFLGRFSLQDANPSLLVQGQGDGSAITSLRSFAGQLVIGGRYAGSLPFADGALPAVAGTAPMVVVMDPKTQHVVWTYPDATTAGGFDAKRWYSVVEVAALGTADCGAVYIAGCSVPTSASTLDCVTFEPGKTGFVSKLDFATGRVIWTTESALGDPTTDSFVPTALTAAEDHVWLAATFNGTVDGFGTKLKSGISHESAVVRLTP